ncbi:MAG: rhomboid family intramembrane serine protease [Bacteroidetes bacterium]|nr:rhomboid family intramembrane serine protease [Bacteroidota bacterium]
MRNTTSKLFFSILYPGLFLFVLWGIKLFETVEKINLSWYGLYPRTFHGLFGIITSPLLHADFSHLIANSAPLLILGPVIFYFYRSIAFQIFFWVYLMTGIWVWAIGRDAYHIGASGIIYGFVTFLFFSGVFRKDTRLLALSMFVVFLYGGTVWGILPLRSGMSWESHLLGALAGLITAYHFRNEGPASPVYDFGDDDENEKIDVSDDYDSSEIVDNPANEPPFTYNFVPKEKDPE